MKKLFTLVALLTCFLGAKADEVEVAKIDYSTMSSFTFYVMGYVPEWFDGVMTDFGSDYRYATQDVLDNGDNEGKGKLEDGESIVGTAMAGATEYQKVTGKNPYWHQYFVQTGIGTEIDGKYKVVAMIKASETVNLQLVMQWNWSGGNVPATASVGTEWAEVEWEYSGIAGTSCDLIAQPGTSAATIEWKWIKVYQDKKKERPTVWQEWLNSDGKSFVLGEGSGKNEKYMGDAETPWADPNVKFNDTEKNYLICAWSKERMRNLGEPDGEGKQGWNPFPADIEVDPDNANNHVFVCHGKEAITEGDPGTWDNQFWIQSPKSWKEGTAVKVKFRYKASKEVKTATQIHKQNPSDYLHWNAIGDVTFTTEWQDFEKTITFDGSQATGWSVAFNLNANDREAIDFYWDDLSWQTMVLEEGFFVAGTNTVTGMPEYDFDNPVKFVESTDEEGCVEAYIGTKGDKSTYVNQIMISTICGNAASYKSNTIKPKGTDPFVGEDKWCDYEPSSIAKINLPMVGAWKIYLDTENSQMNILMLDGEEVQLADVITNPAVITVEALEREYTEAEAEAAGVDKPETPGQAWDNQFWIIANRILEAGEETVVEFDYVATQEAKASTQTHAQPGGYIHHVAIGDVNFTTTEQHFSADYTIPSEAAGKSAQSIAFNLAEIKAANNYTFKNFKWYLKSEEEGKTSENLINDAGETNFAWKVVGGQIITGIENVTVKKNVPAAIYNIAGQRVNNNYKGLVIKEGKKFVNK
jgi:hypothetical protein